MSVGVEQLEPGRLVSCGVNLVGRKLSNSADGRPKGWKNT